jgi:hypothetical protein
MHSKMDGRSKISPRLEEIFGILEILQLPVDHRHASENPASRSLRRRGFGPKISKMQWEIFEILVNRWVHT